MPPMNRREALKTTTVLVGGVLVASAGLTACDREPREPREPRGRREPHPPTETPSGVLSADDRELVEGIADTLLPTTTASPGAKAAGAGAAIDLLLTDCYEPDAQRRVVQGLKEFRARCRDQCGGGFASLAPRQRERLLREIDAEARKVGETHYFGLVRELALRAYFSSEVGMTKALRYVQTPGRWVGCTPLKPGQPAWG